MYNKEDSTIILSKTIKLLLLAYLTTIVSGDQLSYKDHVPYKITPESEKHISVLQELTQQNQFQFVRGPTEVGVDVAVLVAPTLQGEIEDVLITEKLKWVKATPTIQSYENGQIINKYIKHNISSFTWDGYYNLQDIQRFFQDLTAEFKDAVSPVKIGKSVEGRNIEGIKISYGTATNKTIIFFECGIHAREWIAPAFCTYAAKEILTSKDPEMRSYAEEFEWIIIPVANPDGYYWSTTKNRLWRKNRSLTNLTGVYGVDLNRNFDVFWNTVGASSDPKSRNYAGPYGDSEPEITDYIKYLETITDRMDLHLAFHSYGQYILTPYGYTFDRPSNYDDLKTIGDKAAVALATRYGTKYLVGTSADLVTRDSGSAQDYVKYKLNTPLVYCYEMRSENFEFSFLLPADQILPNNLEVWDAIIATIREAKVLGYLQRKS